MRGAERHGTRRCNAPKRSGAPSDVRVLPAGRRNTRTGGRARCALFGKFSGHVSIALPKMTFTSCGAATCIRRRGSIRKNIIGHAAGHGMPVRWKQFLARRVRGVTWRPLALLDQPARKHGASVLFHPLIQQSGNLLSEVGGMREARKLITLQRIARCGEKELPRRLGLGTGHVGLLRRIYVS